MARPVDHFIVHAVWYQRAVHLWAWNGHEVATTARLLRSTRVASRGWDSSGTSTSLVRPESLPVGAGRRHGALTTVPSLRVEVTDLAAVLEAIPSDERSHPLAWFAAVHALADRLVVSARITPQLVIADDDANAVWTPVTDHEIESSSDALARAMPAVCAIALEPTTAPPSPTDRARRVIDEYIDQLARTRLGHRRWRADLGRSRDLTGIRRTFAALSSPDPRVALDDPVVCASIAHLARVFDRHRRQLAGSPVVEARLRLVPPDTAQDPWRVVLELTDMTGRWCTARQVFERDRLAVELAGGSDGLVHLAAVVTDTATGLAERIDALAAFGHSTAPTEVLLAVDEVVAFLEQAARIVHPGGTALGDVDLIGPEHLVAVAVRVSGTVTPVPADDRAGRLGIAAIIDWSPTIDGKLLDRFEFERLVDAGTTLIHTGGRWVRLDPDDLRRARRFLEGRATSEPVAARDLIDLCDGTQAFVDLRASASADGWVARLLDDADHPAPTSIADPAEPEGFVGSLRQYQRHGLGWMRALARAGLGGCLADDMGLGKTATALAHLLDRPGPHLVICPLSVVHNWEDESRRFTPGLQIHIHHGSTRVPIEPGSLGATDLVLTTYGLITRDRELQTVDWSTVVLDEAQMIKNPATRAARAARRLRARHKFALTGTPVENRLGELWSILDVVNPGLLGSPQAFRERFSAPIERTGDDATVERLRRLTRPFVLRRTKTDRTLIPELPDKIEQIAYAELTAEQRVLYNEVVQQLLGDAARLSGMQRRGSVLAAITRLKQICNHPAHALADGTPLPGRSGKLLRFDQLVADLREIGERALVFTQFREMGALLQQHLADAHGLEVEFLHGGLTRARRISIVEGFQQTSAQPLLVISLRAGGTGLNLTGASQVIHYDRWWNPAVEDQATDRAWRIGQDRVVNVHKLVCRHTIEERIGQVLDDKRELADLAIEPGETWLSELGTAELERLVALDDEPVTVKR